MTYPTKYTRQYDFQSYQTANPTRPLPGDKVNADYNYAEQSIDEIVEFLKGFSRADGALANESVGVDQLSSAVLALIASGGEDIVLPASVITYDNASSGLAAGTVQDAIDELATVTDYISGLIPSPADGTYKLVVKLPYAATITNATTISTAGTCTATFKIDGVALGGTANSVSTSENSQAHASASAAAAGTDISLTISANSSCANLSFTITFTRAL